MTSWQNKIEIGHPLKNRSAARDQSKDEPGYKDDC
jgi:hypothetical protein